MSTGMPLRLPGALAPIMASALATARMMIVMSPAKCWNR
jgi:hypothetical protein